MGIEERTSLAGKLISTIHLLVERSTVANTRSVFEKMFIVSQFGNFEANIEFHFDNGNAFHVINKADGKKMGDGICNGAYDNPHSMMDTIVIEQTKEKATAIFSFDGPRIFVGKTYISTESGSQTGFAVEKCVEINEEKYAQLREKPQELAMAWQNQS